MKPRTECACHPVISMMSGIVVPRFALSSEMTAAAFVPARTSGVDGTDFGGRDFALGLDADFVAVAIAVSSYCTCQLPVLVLPEAPVVASREESASEWLVSTACCAVEVQ